MNAGHTWVGDWLGRRARYTPHKEGLVVMPGAQNAGAGNPGGAPLRLTFDQWNRRANRMAHCLRARGIGKGDRVGVLAQNCPEMLDLLFACGKLGAIFVPYNWRLTAAELAPLVADSQPGLLLCGPHCAAPAAVALVDLQLEQYPDSPPEPVTVDLEDPWMILYTGGTTGRAKGAVLSHRQVTWNAWNTIAGWGLSPDDRVPILTPFFHTGGLNVLTTPLVQLGGTSVLMGPFDPGQLLEAVTTERLSIIFMVPTMFQMMTEHPGFAAADFARIKFLISGGASCPRPVAEAYWAKGVIFKTGYGMTEVGPNCFALPDHEMQRRAGSVGFPIFHAGMRLMVDDRACGPGEVGELQIAGPHLCSGYWGDPAASRESNPDGWFRTGDLAYQDDEGFYYIVDRKKDMFISGGENVYPVEVETVLYRHPAVAEAAVVGVPDARWGEVGKAFVALKRGRVVSEAELIAHCRTQLARYKVPKSVAFRPSLPKSAAGKILKRALRD
ncbi:MAG: putative long-chain fatty-acid-CoA ligase [Firmicutes bacterium]|nr:putative long-chain fatty-acid-CoA ligase [Bacillota bacterium]